MKDNLKFYFTILNYIHGTKFMDLKSVPGYFCEHFGLRKDEAINIIDEWIETKREQSDYMDYVRVKR
jgi:hypothetical protein